MPVNLFPLSLSKALHLESEVVVRDGLRRFLLILERGERGGVGGGLCDGGGDGGEESEE